MLRYISRNRSEGDDIRVQSTPFFAVSLLYVKISPYPDRGEDELIGPTSFPIPQNHIQSRVVRLTLSSICSHPGLETSQHLSRGGKEVSGGTEGGSDVANRV